MYVCMYVSIFRSVVCYSFLSESAVLFRVLTKFVKYTRSVRHQNVAIAFSKIAGLEHEQHRHWQVGTLCFYRLLHSCFLAAVLTIRDLFVQCPKHVQQHFVARLVFGKLHLMEPAAGCPANLHSTDTTAQRVLLQRSVPSAECNGAGRLSARTRDACLLRRLVSLPGGGSALLLPGATQSGANRCCTSSGFDRAGFSSCN